MALRRWWDGERWTSRVDGPLDVSAASEAIARGADRDTGRSDRSHRRRVRRGAHDRGARATGAAGENGGAAGDVPLGALAPAFVAICLGAPLTFVLLVVAQERLPGRPVAEAAAFLALWTSAAIATVWASKRYGTGDVAADTRFVVRPFDVLAGVLVAVVVVQAHAVAVRLVAAGAVSGLGPRSGFLTPPHVQPDHLVVMTLLLAAVIGPVVEEMFFRGIVQSALASRFHPAVAIVGQAAVAGACHANPGLGFHTLSVVLAATAASFVLGVARQWSGRLGPGLVAHSVYQVLVVLAVLRGA